MLTFEQQLGNNCTFAYATHPAGCGGLWSQFVMSKTCTPVSDWQQVQQAEFSDSKQLDERRVKEILLVCKGDTQEEQ